MVKKEDASLDKETVLGNLLDFQLVRKSTVMIYGRPLTGKTLLVAYEAARLARMYGGGVLLVVSEVNYSVRSTYDAVTSILSSMGVQYEVVSEKFSDRIVSLLYHLMREEQDRKEEEGKDWVPKYRVLIVDSLRSIAMAEQTRLSYAARKQARVVSVSGIRSTSWVVWNMSMFAESVDGWAFAIASATSTAGTGLYQGLVPYTPTMSEKALHDVSALIWLGSARDFPERVRSDVKKMGKKPKDVKMAVTVLHRSMPGGDGVVFELTKSEQGFVKPVPLFKVKYEYEEEEDVL